MKRTPVLALLAPALLVSAAGSAAAAEMTFWHSFTQPARIAAMETIAARFEGETGNKVNLEVVPWPNVTEKWTTAAAGGTLPDVSICLPSVCMDMNEAGVSRSMDGVLALMGGTDAFASQGLLDTFNTVEGELISLPFYNHARLLIYRKDIFEEVGVEAPTTWEEFVEVARATTNAPERYGLVQYFDPADTGATQYLFLAMRANGGSYFDKEGNAALNTPENIEAVRTMLELYEAGSPEGELSLAYHRDLFDMFTTGKSVMVLDTAFIIGTLEDRAPELLEADAVGFARPPAGVDTPWRIGHIGITTFQGDNEDLADQWVAYLYQDENYIEFLHTIPAGMYPATKSVAENPDFFEHPTIAANRTAVDLTLEGVAKGTDIGMVHGLNPNASVVEGSGIIERMFQDIILNGTDVEVAVASAHDEIQELIDRTRRR